MTVCSPFHRWECDPESLGAMTPAKVRDLMVKCFLEAQKETCHRTKQANGADTEEEIHRTVVAGIRGPFKLVEGDYEVPSRETLMKVVESLARKAKLWGIPPDIIEYHKRCMDRVFAMLKWRAIQAR